MTSGIQYARAKGWIMGFEFCSLICVKKAARIRSQSKVVGWWHWRNDAAGFLSAGGAGAMMPATALPTQDQADVKMMATLAMPPLEQNKAADSFGQRTSNPLLSTASRGIYEAHMWENSCQREARATSLLVAMLRRRMLLGPTISPRCVMLIKRWCYMEAIMRRRVLGPMILPR